MIKRLLRNRFVLDAAILQGSGGIIAVLGAISTLALAHLIGAELQGRYILATSVYGLAFMLFNTGVTQAAVSQMGIAVAENRAERVAGWLAFLVKVYAAGGLFLLLVVGPFLPWICEQLLDSRAIGVFGWILCAVPLLDLPRVVAVAVFQASRSMKEVARIEVLTEIARFSCVLGGALITGDTNGPVFGLLVSTVIGSAVSSLRFRAVSAGTGMKLPSIRRVLAGVRDVPVRRGLGLGLRLGVLRSLDALSYDIVPPLMIKAAGTATGFAGAEAAVAHFRIAQRLMRLPVVLMQGVSRTALPALAHFVGRGDGEGFRRAFLRVTGYSTLLVAVAVGVTTLASPLLVKMAPDEYHEQVVHLVRIMAIGYCAMGSMVAYDTFYILTERLRVAIGIIGVQCTVTFISFWFICYHLPETGGAWGMVLTISWTLAHLVYIFWYFRSGRHVEDFARRALLRAQARTASEERTSGGATTGEGVAGEGAAGEGAAGEGATGEVPARQVEALEPTRFEGSGSNLENDAATGGEARTGGFLARLFTNRFARDAGLLQLSGMVVASGGLASTLALSHLIGSNEQGRYFLALAGYGLCYMLLSVGVVQATVAQVAAARARRQWDKVAAWLAFAFKVQALIGVVLLAIGYFTVVPLVEFATDDREIALFAWWMCATPLLEAPRTSVTCALQGARRMRALATLDVIVEFLRITIVVTSVLVGRSAQSAILGLLAASCVSSVVAMFVLRRDARVADSELPTVRAVLARVGDVPILHGLPLSFRMGVLRTIDALALNILPMLIFKHVSVQQNFAGANDWVAYFRIAQRIMQIPVILLQGLSRTALPSLSVLAGSKTPARFKSLFLRISGVGGLLVAGGLVVAYPVMLLVVQLFDPTYHEPVARLAAILVLGLALQGFAGALDSFYITANRLRVAIVISFIGLLVAMPVVALFVHHNPTTGIAWGMSCTLGWTLVHYTYVLYYFKSGAHLRDLAPEETVTP
ncbi:Polysaccharide biosynthesis protein [Planctomycetes bacterium Pla163]|uniref:Polysaccharide biosynthesis protein n=1 Tax=Rohdeia mirabilis TaxID=2528008 RepID=A0A518D0A8_9BACT|nr:Polysaccharide biosynthesis protein [Planctomycetes bacterium Pla163]